MITTATIANTAPITTLTIWFDVDRSGGEVAVRPGSVEVVGLS